MCGDSKLFGIWKVVMMKLLFLVMVVIAAPLTFADENEYQQINWIELMPKSDLEALLDPPEYLNEIADGSELDTIDSLKGMAKNGKIDRFQQALTSTQVIESMNAKKVRLPGFIVPLENNEQQKVTEFFIVPYFGACLHMPPPPPNQMIFVSYADGIELPNLYDPFWFEGVLNIQLNENELGTSAYGMRLDRAYLYEE